MNTILRFTAVVGLVVLATDADAKPKLNRKLVRQCAGQYDGAADASSITEGEIFYTPFQFSVSKKGVITGDAAKSYFPTNGTLVESVESVDGKIRRAKKSAGGMVVCKGKATGSDGTTFRFRFIITKSVGLKFKSVTGSTKKDSFLGTIAATGL